MSVLRIRRLTQPALGVLSFAVIFLIWETASRWGLVDPLLASRPSSVAAALAQQARSGELWQNIHVSLREFAAGFGAATLAGLVLGVVSARYRTLEYILDPFVWFLYSAPLIAFYPLFVIWLGLGERTVMAITFLFAVTPIMVNTLAGIRTVSPALLRASRSFGANDADLLWKVVVPASVPMVIAGLRLGIGRALAGVIVAELFGSTAGLGHSVAYYGGLLKTADVFASLAVIAALGVLCTQVLSALEARVDSWRTGPGL